MRLIKIFTDGCGLCQKMSLFEEEVCKSFGFDILEANFDVFPYEHPTLVDYVIQNHSDDEGGITTPTYLLLSEKDEVKASVAILNPEDLFQMALVWMSVNA